MNESHDWQEQWHGHNAAVCHCCRRQWGSQHQLVTKMSPSAPTPPSWTAAGYSGKTVTTDRKWQHSNSRHLWTLLDGLISSGNSTCQMGYGWVNTLDIPWEQTVTFWGMSKQQTSLFRAFNFTVFNLGGKHFDLY